MRSLYKQQQDSPVITFDLIHNNLKNFKSLRNKSNKISKIYNPNYLVI